MRRQGLIIHKAQLLSLPKIFSIRDVPHPLWQQDNSCTLNPVLLYELLSEPNTCGFERMLAMNIDMIMNIVSQFLQEHNLMLASLFPGLSCFYLPFVFTILHRSGRLAKNGEALRAFIT